MSSIAAPMSFDQYKKNAPKQGGYMGKYERTGNIEQDYKNYTNQAGFDLYKGSFQGDKAALARYDQRNPGARESQAAFYKEAYGRPTTSSGQGANMSAYRQTKQSGQNQGSGNAQYSAYSPKQTQQTSQQPQYSSLSMAPGSTPQQVEEANRNWQNWMNQTGTWDQSKHIARKAEDAAASKEMHDIYKRSRENNNRTTGSDEARLRMIREGFERRAEEETAQIQEREYRKREEQKRLDALRARPSTPAPVTDNSYDKFAYGYGHGHQADNTPKYGVETGVSAPHKYLPANSGKSDGGITTQRYIPQDNSDKNVMDQSYQDYHAEKNRLKRRSEFFSDPANYEGMTAADMMRLGLLGSNERVSTGPRQGYGDMPIYNLGSDGAGQTDMNQVPPQGGTDYGDPTGDMRGRMLELARQHGGSFGGDGAGYKLTVPPQGGTPRADAPQASSSRAGPLYREYQGMSDSEKQQHIKMRDIATWAAGTTNPAVQQDPKQRRHHEAKARELFGSTSGPSAKQLQEALEYGNRMNKVAQGNILGSRDYYSSYNVGEEDDFSGTSFMRQNQLDALQELLGTRRNYETKRAEDKAIGDQVRLNQLPQPFDRAPASGGGQVAADTVYGSGVREPNLNRFPTTFDRPSTPSGQGMTPENTGAGSRKNPYGFTPPDPDMMTTQAMVPYHNPTTGETWTAPSGGWQAPKGWKKGNPPSNQTGTQNQVPPQGGGGQDMAPMSKTDIREMNNSLEDFAGNLDAAPSGDDFPGLEEVMSQYAPVASTSTGVSSPSVTTETSSTGGVRTTTMPGIVPTSSSYIPGTSMSQPSSSMVMTAPVVSQDNPSFDNYAENMEAYQQGNEMGQAAGRPATQPNARLGNIVPQNQNYDNSHYIPRGGSRRDSPQASQPMQQGAQVPQFTPMTTTAQEIRQNAPAPAPQPQFAEDVTQFAAPGSIDIDAIAAAYSPGQTVGQTTGMDEYLAKTAAFEQQMANSQPQMNFGLLGGGTGTFSEAMSERDAFINRINEARRPAFANPGSGAGRNLDFGALLEQAG
jgi:hypothetical protein